MKLKRIAAALTAVFTAASLSVSAFAEKYSARLGFADADWTALDWETCTTVTGDGTYTIKSDLVAGADDIGVMLIEIIGMAAKAPEASAILDKIEIDGRELEFDPSKIIYDNSGKDGNYIIEIFSAYGNTVADPGVKQATAINSSLKLTFTVSGLDSAASETIMPVTVTTVQQAEMSVPETTSVPKTETSVPETTSVPKTETSVPETTSVPKTETSVPETTSVPKMEMSVPETTSVPKTEMSASETTSAPQTENEAAEGTAEPESDGMTESAGTGNTGAAASAAVMLCAGAAAVISRKKPKL